VDIYFTPKGKMWTVIYPISLLELLEGSELERFLQVKKTLQAGDILEGRVIKLFNQAEALIDFGSFRARAQVQVPLSPGELLKVMVIDAGEKIHFQIQNPEKAVSVDARALSGFIERNQWIDLKKMADFIEQVAEKISPNKAVRTMSRSAEINRSQTSNVRSWIDNRWSNR
jgi:hypothetical protein